jgi:hypothetical protein
MQSVHEGKQFKLYLTGKGLSNYETYQRLKISRQCLYYQYRREFLTPAFKAKLLKAGLYPFLVEDDQDFDNKCHKLEVEIKKLNGIISAQAELITNLLAQKLVLKNGSDSEAKRNARRFKENHGINFSIL